MSISKSKFPVTECWLKGQKMKKINILIFFGSLNKVHQFSTSIKWTNTLRLGSFHTCLSLHPTNRNIPEDPEFLNIFFSPICIICGPITKAWGSSLCWTYLCFPCGSFFLTLNFLRWSHTGFCKRKKKKRQRHHLHIRITKAHKL